MIENPPVLTIHRGHRRPAPALLEAFRGAATSHLVDAMEGRGAMDWRIKPLDPANARFTGPALTAHSYPADIYGMVGAGMGVSIVPEMAIEKKSQCRYVRIADEQAVRTIGAVVLRGRSLTRAPR